MRMAYVDDSGSERAGLASFSWVEVDESDWSLTLGRWLDFRDWLWHDFGIGKSVELHSTEFVNGRGRPSTDDAFNASKRARRDAFEQGMKLVASLDGLVVGTVFGRTAGRRAAYREERLRVYRQLVTILDERMRNLDQRILVVMDGDGTDSGYLGAHRALRPSTRHVIEDPLFQPSDRSHWLQMADMVAYSAYQEVLALPEKSFAHGWYALLRARDVHGGPQQV